MRNKILLVTVLSLASSPVFAGEPCRKSKDLINLAQAFYGDTPELRNVITPNINMALKGINGAPDPSAMLYRHEGESHILPVVDGKLTGLEQAAKWSKGGEMCRMVEGDIAPATEGETVEVSMNFSFKFNRTDGVFAVDELKEGAKDGSKIMNGLAPGGLGFAVPGLKSISLHPAEELDAKPVYEFRRKGEVVTVKASPIGNTTLFRLKDIKSSKADMFIITGPYQLYASFKFDPEDIAKAEAKRIAELAATEE